MSTLLTSTRLLKILVESLVKEQLKEDKFADVEKFYAKKPNGKMIGNIWLASWKLQNIPVKYVEWMARIVYNIIVDPTIQDMKWIEDEYQHTMDGLSWLKYGLPTIIKKFDTLTTKNIIKQKDINSYKSIRDFVETVEQAEKELSKRQEKEGLKGKGTKKIYEDDRYLLIEPLTKESAQLYGKGTRWCISASESENYFDEYYSKGQRFVFIIDKKPESSTPEWLRKIAISFSQQQGTQLQGFNARDTMMTHVEISDALPTNVLEVLNQYIDTNVFERFSQEEFIQGLPKTATKVAFRRKFAWEAPIEKHIEALKKLVSINQVDEGFAYVTTDFVEQILDELNRRPDQPVELLEQVYQLAILAWKQKSFAPDMDKIRRLLRKIVWKKLTFHKGNQATVAYILLELFIENPRFIEKIIEKYGTENEFVKQFMIRVKASEGLFGNIERTFKSQPEITSNLLKAITSVFKENGYNFENMIAPL